MLLHAPFAQFVNLNMSGLEERKGSMRICDLYFLQAVHTNATVFQCL